jgi:hypothetical protein
VCIDERPLDGKRFLMVQLPDREPQIERRQIDLVLNWGRGTEAGRAVDPSRLAAREQPAAAVAAGSIGHF